MTKRQDGRSAGRREGPGRGRGIRTAPDVRERRRDDVALRYPQGATDEELAAKWNVTKTTIAKDRRARGVAPRPTGRRPESPLPEPRVCEADGCGKEFTPTRSQVKAGWGRFCSTECMATDRIRREVGHGVIAFFGRNLVLTAVRWSGSCWSDEGALGWRAYLIGWLPG